MAKRERDLQNARRYKEAIEGLLQRWRQRSAKEKMREQESRRREAEAQQRQATKQQQMQAKYQKQKHERERKERDARWRWMNRLVPVTWVIYALSASQMGSVEVPLTGLGAQGRTVTVIPRVRRQEEVRPAGSGPAAATSCMKQFPTLE